MSWHSPQGIITSRTNSFEKKPGSSSALDREYESWKRTAYSRAEEVCRARAAGEHTTIHRDPHAYCAHPQLAALPIADSRRFFSELQLAGWRGEIANRLVREVSDRLTFLSDVGLDYLSLDRSAETLSGGEAQRIRLASQIGSGLVGVMYILDEPSIGLHQRDNQRLLDTLNRLRDLGNTVLVVEHDEDAIRQAVGLAVGQVNLFLEVLVVADTYVGPGGADHRHRR